MASAAVLGIQAGVQLVSALLYLWVGRIVVRREVEPDMRRANSLFGVWWFGLGLVFLVAPVFTLSTRVFGYRDVASAAALIEILLVLIVAAVWGLVYYLVFLYTGTQRWFWPITVFYALFAAGVVYLITWLDPNGFDANGMLTYTRKEIPGGPGILIGLAFSVPVVVAAIAYGSLYFRVRTSAARFRIGLISAAFLLQFGWSVVSTSLQLSRRYPNNLTLSFISSGLAVISAISVLIAFRPPASIRARLEASDQGGLA